MRTEGHTPGPWVADETENGWVFHAPASGIDVVWTEDMTEADARLIEAAPELHKELCDLVASITALAEDGCSLHGGWIYDRDGNEIETTDSLLRGADAAVAKVEGRDE